MCLVFAIQCFRSIHNLFVLSDIMLMKSINKTQSTCTPKYVWMYVIGHVQPLLLFCLRTKDEYLYSLKVSSIVMRKYCFLRSALFL